jgi:peroxiredoxin family protein
MSTMTDKEVKEWLDRQLAGPLAERIEAMVDKKVAEALAKEKESRPKRIAMVLASKGTLDGAYPPLILATTAISLGMEAGIFFTFFGLHILKKGAMDSLKFVPLGNPATPMPMPNILTMLPGMTAMATLMMKRTIKQQQIASLPELWEVAKECGVRLMPCQMTMDMFGLKKEDLVEGLEEPVGAATFLDYASEADITLFM